ncbi:MAG: ATPase domain-containing protein [Halobacteriota archaeon]|nr:ATPase domain-containing protein [Halobacteriota archaeon]
MKEEDNIIPPDILDAIESSKGFSLLVKGEPGTGKTTLALELLKRIGGVSGVYLSTRVTPASLYSHFPWLEECERPINVIDTTKFFISADSCTFGLQSFPEVLCSRLEKIEKPATVVIDSWDAVTFNEEEFKVRMLEATIAELVRQRNIKLIFVSENMQTNSLDYMVDGIVLLRDIRIDYRRAREVLVKKLRGTNIRQPNYPFTLQNGRFRCFMPFDRSNVEKPKKQSLTPDTGTHISTGSLDLDRLLSGGYRRGSFNIVEVGSDISTWGFQAIVGPTVRKFINQKNWFVDIPCCGRNEEQLRRLQKDYVNSKNYDECVRVFEVHTSTDFDEEKNENVIPLEAESIGADLSKIKNFILELSPPVLTIIGVDTLEFPYNLRGGDKLGVAIKELNRHITNTKTRGNIDIARVDPGLSMTQQLINMASTYLKLMSLDGTIILYGIKPETGLFNVDIDTTEGYPELRLTPYV